MGNKQPKQLIYSVEVSEAKKGETPIYRNPLTVDKLATTPQNDLTNLQSLILNSEKKYSNLKFIGSRTGPNRAYKFKTYQEIITLSRQLGSAIIQLNLIPEIKHYEDINVKLIGIHAPNREEWLILDIANMLYGNTMVPIYDTLGSESVEYVINHSEIKTLFCQASTVKSTLNCKNIPNLKNIVMIDEFPKEIQQEAIQKGLKLFKWEDLLEAGKQNLQNLPDIPNNACYTFSYTSGTTGNPKGVMIGHKNALSIVASFVTPPTITENDVHLSYLPLPHVLERICILAFIYCGSSVCIYGGDLLKLKEDLADVKPTNFVSVPRLYNKFYSGITAKFEQATGLQKILINKALNDKLYYLEHEGAITHKLWDALVFNKTKAILGGRCKLMLSGSAPISKEVANFLKVTMCAIFKEGYGMTESTGSGFVTLDEDITIGHVGGPTVPIEVKLIDVPDMNYTSLDIDEEGRLQPRGEICLRGPCIFQGYYKEKQKTDETKDKEGWLHTGDIAMRLPSGAFKIIDRKKNIFKLCQGEYVAPEKVENIYVRAPIVEQVFLHGDSLENFCIGVIHPNEQVFMELAKKENQQGTFEELCKNQVMKKVILEIITQYGKAEKLFGFEQAKQVLLVHQSFQDYGCLTSSMKLQRHHAKKCFKEDLLKIYQESKK